MPAVLCPQPALCPLIQAITQGLSLFPCLRPTLHPSTLACRVTALNPAFLVKASEVWPHPGTFPRLAFSRFVCFERDP